MTRCREYGTFVADEKRNGLQNARHKQISAAPFYLIC
jgi:hypothetical protein